MTPEYYADLYRRYGLYARNYGDNKLYRIACGARNDDYHWTEVLMEQAGARRPARRAAIWTAWRCTTTPRSSGCPTARAWDLRRSSTRPSGSRSCPRALFMDELVRQHSHDHGQVRSQQEGGDDRGRVGHLVRRRAGHASALPLPAEHDARRHRRGDDARHLQQALRPRAHGQHRADGQRAAGDDADRQGEKMLLTPSYHVFEMYAAHQDATMVPVRRGERALRSTPATACPPSRRRRRWMPRASCTSR